MVTNFTFEAEKCDKKDASFSWFLEEIFHIQNLD